MIFNLLPPGHFGPASFRTLVIVTIVALFVAGLFSWLLVHAARIS